MIDRDELAAKIFVAHNVTKPPTENSLQVAKSAYAWADVFLTVSESEHKRQGDELKGVLKEGGWL